MSHFNDAALRGRICEVTYTPGAMKMTSPIYKHHPQCPFCKCTIVVWKRKGFKESFLRTFAIADHMKALHRAAKEW